MTNDGGSPAAEAKILERGAGLRRLDDALVLEISGEDAHAWLGGQVTNAVQQTKPGDAVYALFTSVKGKILADAWVLHVAHDDEADTLWAVVPARAREALLESFDKYIVMEDVEVRPREDLAVLTVQGPGAGEVVAKVEVAARASWPCDRLGTGGRDIVAPTDGIGTVEAELRAAGARTVGEEGWELARVRLGVPSWGRDFDDRNYPQEAGLKKRAVSFTKGCYLGQEVVCMLENRGKLSKRLVQLELGGDGAPEPDASVEAEGKPVGRVTSALRDPDDGVTRAFAYVKSAFAEPGREVRAGGRGATVRRVVG